MVPYTFIGPTSNSRIDHILYAAIGGTVLSCDIVDNHLYTDHVPLKVVYDFNVGHVDLVERPHIRQTAWWKASSCDIQEYRTRLDNKVDNFVYDNCIENCTDVMCTKHDIEISSMYNNVIQLCLEAAEDIPKTGQLTSNKRIPGWSEHVEHLRREALVWHHHWRACGQPHEGDVAERRRVSRTEYHRAVKSVKKNRDIVIMERMAEAIENNRTRDLWEEVNRIKGRNRFVATNIDGATNEVEVIKIFENKYRKLYNCVPNSRDEIQSVQLEMHSKLQMNCHDIYMISVEEVIKSVDKLKSGKSDEDSIYSDHIINGTPKLFGLFTRMFNAMLVHGSCSLSMVNGTMIPIPKGRRVMMSSSDNYRAITVGSTICKLFEYVILNKEGSKLGSNDLRLGLSKMYRLHSAHLPCRKSYLIIISIGPMFILYS